VVEGHFDPVLGREELVEGAVPGVELAGMDADPSALVPVRDEASALTVADEVGLEPGGEPVLAGRGEEPVGHEHEGAVGERDGFGPPEVLVEDGPKAQVVEPGTDDEDGPPGRGLDDLGTVWGGVFLTDVAAEQSLELGEHLNEEVLASEIGNDALLDLAAVAVGFDDADGLVDGAAGGADFHGSWVHENHYHDESLGIQGDDSGYSRPILNQIVTTIFRAGGGPPHAKGLENKAFSRAGPPAWAASPQTWASSRSTAKRRGWPPLRARDLVLRGLNKAPGGGRPLFHRRMRETHPALCRWHYLRGC
jgi:hypothetical protein